jgi:ATP-dependent DNA ligase
LVAFRHYSANLAMSRRNPGFLHSRRNAGAAPAIIEGEPRRFRPPIDLDREAGQRAGQWIYELKFDGYRALAFKTDKEVRLVSRNQVAFKYLQFRTAVPTSLRRYRRKLSSLGL